MCLLCGQGSLDWVEKSVQLEMLTLFLDSECIMGTEHSHRLDFEEPEILQGGSN